MKLYLIKLYYALLYSVFFISFFCVSYVKCSDDSPEWVKTRKSTKYPDKQYIVGVGEIKSTGNIVEDKKNADKDGYSQIANQIITTVKSESQYKTYEIIADNSSQYTEKSESNIKISSYVELSGFSVVDRYYDKDEEVFYSLTILDRNVSLKVLKSKMQQTANSYDENLKLADENASKGAIFQALLNIKESIRQVNLFNLLVPFYQIISKENTTTDDLFNKSLNKNDAVNKFGQIISSLNITKISGEDQDVRDDKSLDKPLQVKVSATGSTQPAEGILVGFLFVSGNGEIKEKVRTDNNGIASANVTTIKKGHKEYEIKSFIDLSEFLDTAIIFSDLNQLLKGYDKEEIFKLTKKDIYKNSFVLVQVDENIGSNKSDGGMISNTLSQKLMENGMTAHTNNKGSTYTILITGTFNADRFNEMSGIVVYNVSGTIQAKLSENGKTIAVENVQDIKGMGKTDEQAANNALKKAAEKFIDSFISQIVSGEFR